MSQNVLCKAYRSLVPAPMTSVWFNPDIAVVLLQRDILQHAAIIMTTTTTIVVAMGTTIYITSSSSMWGVGRKELITSKRDN